MSGNRLKRVKDDANGVYNYYCMDCEVLVASIPFYELLSKLTFNIAHTCIRGGDING